MGNAVVIIQKWSLPVNVSELVHFETRNGIAAHYDYAPFGAVTRSVSASTITDNTFTSDNPFRFSSEYHDDTLGLVYYNYRHYNPIDGRWCGRDLVNNSNLYLVCLNAVLNNSDLLGMETYLPFSFNRLPDGDLSQPFDMPLSPGTGMAASVTRYGYLDDHNSMTNSLYDIEEAVNTKRALLSHPCCLPNGEKGVRYEVKAFVATNRKTFYVNRKCRKFSRKYTTGEHEEMHSKNAESCFLESVKILRNMSSECISERCDPIRKKSLALLLVCYI